MTASPGRTLVTEPPNVFNPARVLVPQGVRKVRMLDLPPDPLDHVKVRPAQAGPTDANDYVVRTPDLRAGYVVQLEVFVIVAVESSSLHRSSMPEPRRGCESTCQV